MHGAWDCWKSESKGFLTYTIGFREEKKIHFPTEWIKNELSNINEHDNIAWGRKAIQTVPFKRLYVILWNALMKSFEVMRSIGVYVHIGIVVIPKHTTHSHVFHLFGIKKKSLWNMIQCQFKQTKNANDEEVNFSKRKMSSIMRFNVVIKNGLLIIFIFRLLVDFLNTVKRFTKSWALSWSK